MSDLQKHRYDVGEFEPGWTEGKEKLEALSTKICKAIAGALQRKATQDEMETVLLTVNECLKAGHTDEALITVYAMAALSDFSIGPSIIQHH